MIRRARRKHVLQERIARDVNRYHDRITQELQTHGCEMFFNLEQVEQTPQSTFSCSDCDRTFATRQALAAHEYQKHGTLSLDTTLHPIHDLHWMFEELSHDMACPTTFTTQTQQMLESHLWSCISC